MAEAMQRITNTVIIETMINLWNHLPVALHTKYVHSNNPHELNYYDVNLMAASLYTT